MQAPKTKGHSCPHPSAHQTSDNCVPCPCTSPMTLESITRDIAQDLGFTSHQNLPTSLSNKQAAQVLHVSPDTLALWRSTGRHQLHYQKIGRYIRYPVQSLAQFIQSRTFSHTKQTGGAV